MPVGFPTKVNYATGDVLSAANMNDLSGTVNLLESAQYAAGKNKIINGDFGIWQRGTSFTNLISGTYTVDRWNAITSNTTIDVTRSSFSPGTAPVSGYESSFFATIAVEATDTDARFQQLIEDVRTFAGQTITISFWAKSNVTTDALRWIRVQQAFGGGGSPSANVNTDSSAITLTSSWTRYSVTVAVPSISGKTIGTTSSGYLGIGFGLKASTAQTLDLWGVQVEAGSTASPFQTATGTKQGELAACQRYFQKTNNQTEVPGAAPSVTPINALNASSTLVVGIPPFKVNMRTGPTVVLYSASTGASGKIRSGGADVTATAADVGEYSIGYISATGLVSGSNSTVTFTASAEL
jgi:hypothetical protein